jgi:CO/xanthine dehydrogenase Mo-binding subunit
MAKRRGRGIAAIEYPTGMNQNGDPSQAWVKLKPDGRVDVFSGTVDIGQGSKTVHTQIVADTLGVPYDWVTMDNTNTDSSPVCTGSFASRGTFIGGNAVRFAAERAKERVLAIAARQLETDAGDLELEDGEVYVRGARDRSIGVSDVAAIATWVEGELITGTGAAFKPYAVVDPEDGSVEIEPHSAISYGGCVADVTVDTDTGQVEVERLVQVYDIGRAINPTLVEGQSEGGAMQGLGLGLLEACYPYYPSAEHRGGEFGTYLAPGVENLPEIRTVLIENPSVDGPFGAKAIGEMASNSQAPAICAAVHAAIGVWITETPITPEKVLRALDAKAAGAPEYRVEGKRVIFDEAISLEAVGGPASTVRFTVDG